MKWSERVMHRRADAMMRKTALALRMPMIDETPLSQAEILHGVRVGLIRPMERETRQVIARAMTAQPNSIFSLGERVVA